MSNKGNLTRREFIKSTSAAAIGGTLLLGSSALPVAAQAKDAEAIKSRVLLVRDKGVLNSDGNTRYETVLDMLDKALMALVNQNKPLDAWKTIIKAPEVVGIKSNHWRPIGTPSQVEQALKKRVMDVGVSEADIYIDDRGVRKNIGFKRATALINVRPMRTHNWSGVGSLLKNYIMFYHGAFPDWHPDSCADLAKLWELPIVKDKTRLNVLLMLTPQFHSTGPHSFHPKYVWNYYGLLAGLDPVAVDSVGLRIIEAKRRDHFGEERPLNPPAKHIALADTRHKLGNADAKNIQLVKIGYDSDLLI